jgi:tetratricopeptide (TPR) repeat protein
MRARLQARGLAIAATGLILYLLSPTPVPLAVLEAWQAGVRACASGDTASLTQALQALQALLPWQADLREAEIPMALASDDGARALALLEAGTAAQADAAAAACWRAEALVIAGRWQDAAALLRSSGAAVCPPALHRLKNLALGALNQLDAESAIGVLETLASLDPSDPSSKALLGAAMIATDPTHASLLLDSASTAGDPLARELRAALLEVPEGDERSAVAQAGGVFLQQEEWALAALAFQRLTELDPPNGDAYAFLGLARQRLGMDGRAALEQGVRLAPDSSTAQSALGLYWQELGQAQKALPFLRRALELDAENSAFAASLAAAEAESGDVQGALARFLQAAQRDPGSPVFWTQLAAFSLTRHIEIAETGMPAARNACVLQPDAAASIDLLGYGHLLLGDYQLAERLLAKAVRHDPVSASARLHYGLLLVQVNRVPEARAQLTAASDLGGLTPVGELARRALDQLGP